jgi:hypothetical protein
VKAIKAEAAMNIMIEAMYPSPPYCCLWFLWKNSSIIRDPEASYPYLKVGTE